jgi:AcrR family transcriptional regulator
MPRQPKRRAVPAPAPSRRVRLSVDDRRQQLLELGLRAFTDRPYDEVAIDEIARQAGISRGLLFHYFPTKHGYYVAVLRVAADLLMAETVAAAEASANRSPAEQLAAGLDAYFRFVEERGATYATLLRAGVGSDTVVQELVEATRGRFVETIRGHLAPLAGDARLVRAGLRGWIGLVEALALDWHDHRDLRRDELVALAVRGIALVVPQAAASLGRGN